MKKEPRKKKFKTATRSQTAMNLMRDLGSRRTRRAVMRETRRFQNWNEWTSYLSKAKAAAQTISREHRLRTKSSM